MVVGLRRRMALVALLRVFKPGTPGLGRRLAAIPRMLAATVRGDYDGRRRMATMAVVAVYLFSPLEFIADAVFLLVGVVGNAGLATWLVGALMDETERFLEWERQRRAYTPLTSTAMPVASPPAGPAAHAITAVDGSSAPRPYRRAGRRIDQQRH
jgi:uncharacterized membrane protein YkvA (DUF1232 family)